MVVRTTILDPKGINYCIYYFIELVVCVPKKCCIIITDYCRRRIDDTFSYYEKQKRLRTVDELLKNEKPFD